jgi:hypothetical protein
MRAHIKPELRKCEHIGGSARGYQRGSRIVGNRGHGHPDSGKVVFYASPALA